MGAGLQTFDQSGNIIIDVDTLVFRAINNVRIVGTTAGNPNLDGSAGTINDPGLLLGAPYCQAAFEGTINNGTPTSFEPPAPNITISGANITYDRLWGDWRLFYGIT